MSDSKQRSCDGHQGSLFQLATIPNFNQDNGDRVSQISKEELQKALDSSKKMEGFPRGTDDEVLRISVPPLFTACPNPFIEGWLKGNPETSGHSNIIHPFSDDVSAGKNDPLYFAHYYSTKVPPQAIVPYILHFTRPGEIVFDGFCGTGMTGVAAQLCGMGSSFTSEDLSGERKAILSDLSPAATFISAVTNSISLIVPFLDKLEAIVTDVAVTHEEILKTRHTGWRRGESGPSARKNAPKPHNGQTGHVEYVVWSDVFLCSECGTELIYWNLVFRGARQPAPDCLSCSRCGATQSVRTLERVWVNRYDHELGRMIRQAKQLPVLINYSVGKKRFEKLPDEFDLASIEKLEEFALPYSCPIEEMPDGFNTAQPRSSHGFTHVHHFFTRRNLLLMSALWEKFKELPDPRMRCGALFLLTGSIQRVCRLNRYMPIHDRHVGPLSGTLYVSQLTAEIPATNYAIDRIADLRRCAKGPSGKGVIISTQSATDLRNIPDGSIHYIFTDPPFGGNLNYSELNVLVEAWIGVRTNAESEAVVNEIQQKGLQEYKVLMARSFAEFYRILKPGRWLTVEFHNSQNSVWNAIQEGLWNAGFVIADVKTLDKQKGTTKQLSYGSTVKQDLVISSYKPDSRLENLIRLEVCTEESVWDFMRMHLQLLSPVHPKDGRVEVIAERTSYLLFDRMVAFYIQRGATVPLSASEFYAGLQQRFPERDGMYFLPDEVVEYDRIRMDVKDVLQLPLFVADEASAIHWLRQQLSLMPQTFQEIHPHFMKEIGGWQKHEKPLELSEMLEGNFLRYDGKGPIPSQLLSLMQQPGRFGRIASGGERAGEGSASPAETLKPELLAMLKDRWYVPEANKALDLEKIRDRGLLKEFQGYRGYSGRLLKVFRMEAVRAGFKKAWQERDYHAIIEVAQKIPEDILQEDQKLVMWYHQALTRTSND